MQIKGDKAIWVIVLLLSMISIAAVYSSSNALVYLKHKSSYAFLFRQMAFILTSLLFLFAFYHIPIGFYRIGSIVAMPIAIVLLVLTILIGGKVNEASRWLTLFGFSIHTGEIAKIALVMYLARIFEIKEFKRFKEFFWWVLAPVGTLTLLVLYGSISAGIFFTIIVGLIFIIVGVKWSYLLKTSLIVFAAILLVVAANQTFGLFPRVDTAVSRVKSFVVKNDNNSELSDEDRQAQLDRTFQADMARIAVISGGITGKGPGRSTQRDNLPHPYSDFIFAIIIEEYGLIGGFLVLALYLWLSFRFAMIVGRCQTLYSALLVTGLSLLITLQTLLHVIVNVGVLPVTGHTLPLVSLGGSSLIVMGSAFGMILSVSKAVGSRDEQEIKQSEEYEEE